MTKQIFKSEFFFLQISLLSASKTIQGQRNWISIQNWISWNEKKCFYQWRGPHQYSINFNHWLIFYKVMTCILVAAEPHVRTNTISLSKYKVRIENKSGHARNLHSNTNEKKNEKFIGYNEWSSIRLYVRIVCYQSVKWRKKNLLLDGKWIFVYNHRYFCSFVELNDL